MGRGRFEILELVDNARQNPQCSMDGEERRGGGVLRQVSIRARKKQICENGTARVDTSPPTPLALASSEKTGDTFAFRDTTLMKAGAGTGPCFVPHAFVVPHQ